MKNYDPKQVTLTFKGYLITGYAEGTFIQVARNEDSFETSVGADGKVTRVRKNDKSGTITVTLQAESPSNAVLSGFLLADELSGTGYGNVQVKDLNKVGLCAAPNAWVQKPADVENGDTAGNREWTIACDELEISQGGAIL